MKTNLLKKTEILGIFFIFVLAICLRYYYKWGGSPLSILVSSVNNSIWENIKVFIIAYMIWATIEILVIAPSFKKFIVAKVVSIYITGLSGLIVLCLIVSMMGQLELWLIASIIIAFVCISQFFSYYLMNLNKNLKDIFVPCVFLLVLLVVMLCCFSVFPPGTGLFKDLDTGLYGIIPDYIDIGAFLLDHQML